MSTSSPQIPRRLILPPRKLLMLLAAIGFVALGGFLLGRPQEQQQVANSQLPNSGIQADFSSLMELIRNHFRNRRHAGDGEQPGARYFGIAGVALGTAAGALAVWFAVRLINCRRELRSRYLIVGLLAVAAAYPLSFGP